MDGKYTFERFEKELDDGYQMYYTIDIRIVYYLKLQKNCYTQKLISDHPKNPQPRQTVITHKRIAEMFPFMEDIEYKIS